MLRTTLLVLALFIATEEMAEAGRWSVVATVPHNTNFQTMAIGRDCNVWTVDCYFGTVDRFTPGGARTTFSLGNVHPIGIALGSGGEFRIDVLGGDNRLARVTQTGAVRYLNIPDGQPAYGGIVSAL